MFNCSSLFSKLSIGNFGHIHTVKHGEGIPIKVKGTVILKLNGQKVSLTNSFWVPELRTHLISLEKILESNYQLHKTWPKKYSLKAINGEIIPANRDSGLLKVCLKQPLSNFLKRTPSLTYYHHVLGHLNFDQLCQILKSNNISFMDENFPSFPACAITKILRSSFPGHSSRCHLPFQALHFDTIGSINPI